MTHGLAVRPFSTAFLATRAAAIITDGFDVLVQLVMDAIATAPWNRSNDRPSVSTVGKVRVADDVIAGLSDAGNDSRSASSTLLASSGA